MNELQACPFCNANYLCLIAEQITFLPTEYNSNSHLRTSKFRVLCRFCEASTRGYVTEKAAFEAWNTRGGTYERA